MRHLRSQIVLLALSAALLAITSAGGARAQDLSPNEPHSIRLVVTETAGISRSRAPVVAGVPLPLNAAAVDAAAFDLHDSTGESIPFNARVLTRWNGPADDPVGPIRWLALSFVADLAPRSEATFDLVRQPVANPPAEIARNEPAGIVVDTGALGFRVASEGSALFENLRIDMNGDRRVDVRLIGERGAELLWPGAGGPEPVPLQARLLSTGPAEAVVRLEAQPPTSAAASLLVWLHAYRDQPWLRTVVRACDVPTNQSVRLRIPVETLGDPLRAALGVSVGDAGNEWTPGESFSLAPRSVARLVQQDDRLVWSSQLDGQSFLTTESTAWAEVGALGWNVAVGALPGSDDQVHEINLTGSGDIAVDIAPVGGGCGTVELFLQFRGGRARDVRKFQVFSNPLVATAEIDWYQDSLALGAVGLGNADAAAVNAAATADGGWDPTFGLLTAWLGSQGREPAWLRAAARRVRTGTDKGFDDRLGGPLLYFWLTGDQRVHEALVAAAAELLRRDDRASSSWVPLAHLDLWDALGSPAHLRAAQAALRTAAMQLYAAGCDSDPSRAGLTLEGLGRYDWARRLTGSADRQAELALEQLLDRMLSCPATSLMADGFAYGALLAGDKDRRNAYLRAAERALRSRATPGTESGDAATRLHSGQTYAWLRARLGEQRSRHGQ